MEKGYKVTHVYRAWDWKEWTKIVFRGYMQAFLKVYVSFKHLLMLIF